MFIAGVRLVLNAQAGEVIYRNMSDSIGSRYLPEDASVEFGDEIAFDVEKWRDNFVLNGIGLEY